MLTLEILLGIIFVVFGVLAIAALDAKYKLFGGISLIIAGFALLILAVLSVTISLIAIAVAAFLCAYVHVKPA